MICSKLSRKRAGKSTKRPRSVTVIDESRPSDTTTRKTGIRVIGDMPWGTHICIFYETTEDLLDTNAAYLQAGLEGNEFCVWAVSDPITEEDAANSLRRRIANFDRRLATGHIEILPGREWYLKGHQFDLKRITGGWSNKLNSALSRGYAGLRISGNAFWIETNHWKEFCEYERELDESVAAQKMIVMCTYPLRATRAVDLLDVTRAHQVTAARRNGDWEFLHTPELKQANQEISNLRSGFDILSRPFPGHELLTSRERVVLAQIARGASSKEAGVALGVSPRTIDFHRANIMRKFDAKNVVDLVRTVLGENKPRSF